MTYYLVYKTIHLESGRFYIGRHVTNDLNDRYLGSGRIIEGMIKKYGRAAFKREILLHALSFDEMLAHEISQIESVFEDQLCMNLSIGDPITGGLIRHSEKTKAHLRKVCGNFSNDQRKKMSDAAKFKRSDETRQRMSEAHRGKKKSPETIKNISLSKLGIPTGPRSDETKAKMAEAAKLAWVKRRQNQI